MPTSSNCCAGSLTKAEQLPWLPPGDASNQLLCGRSPSGEFSVVKNRGEIRGSHDLDNALSDAGDKLVVVYFSAKWCGPCRAITPAFDKMSKDSEITSQVVFVKIDVDDCCDLAEDCEISCMPTFQFFRAQNKVDEFSGGNKAKLLELVKKLK
ncbi:thioredoxin-like [Diadema antillarum]|uniref:thioredoxin-like n=1 Tax=Diadema antillarum TaxID=105358 RepID=UPI003A8892E6